VPTGGPPATVVFPDVTAGASVVHVIDQVLIPAGLVRTPFFVPYPFVAIGPG
jgi:hypothetical protein